MQKQINKKKYCDKIPTKKQVKRNVPLKADLLLSCLFIVPCFSAVRAASGASAFGISPRLSAGSSEKVKTTQKQTLRARACAQSQAVADSRLMEIAHVIIIFRHAGVVKQGSFRGKERLQAAFSPGCWGVTVVGDSWMMGYTSK